MRVRSWAILGVLASAGTVLIPPPFPGELGGSPSLRLGARTDPTGPRTRSSASWPLACGREGCLLTDRPAAVSGYRRLPTQSSADSGIFRPSTGGACKTVAMDERPVVQQRPRADERRAEHLGPISPELVLVDPLLAEQARKLLPEPDERDAHRERVVRREAPKRPGSAAGATQAALAADARARSGHVRRRGGPGRPPSTRASGAVRRPRGSHGLASTDHPRREPGETACEPGTRRPAGRRPVWRSVPKGDSGR